MITIVCGENTVEARKYYGDLKNEYKDKGYEVQQIPAREIQEQLTKSEQTMSLFASKLVFFTEGLNSLLSRTKNEKLLEPFEALAENKDIEIIDWEEKTARDLKIAKLGKVKEFKADKSIFSFLDMCYPGNKKQFLMTLDALRETQDEIFIFTMLSRHVRTLLLAHEGAFSSRTQPWMRGKLSGQAKKWDGTKLSNFYEGLSKIDVSLKTSGSPFSVKESLDILAVYFL
jgi:DNA polymerase III delta subunit